MAQVPPPVPLPVQPPSNQPMMAVPTQTSQFSSNIAGPTAFYRFTKDNIFNLSDNNFDTDGNIPIFMPSGGKGCVPILFYDSGNLESLQLAQIYYVVAERYAGNLAAIDLRINTKVLKAFIKIGTSDSMYRSFALKQIPFILVYREGYPAAFYNGERVVSAIVDWIMTLACIPGYFETKQLFASVSIPADQNYGIPGLTQYQDNRTQSVQYTSTTPIRPYTAAAATTIQTQVTSPTGPTHVIQTTTQTNPVLPNQVPPGQFVVGQWFWFISTG